MTSDIQIINVEDKNKDILLPFIEKMGSSSQTFRYFQTRSIKNVLLNHELTLVLVRDKSVIGYGHLDREDKLWLGICVIEGETGKGYGKVIMEELLKNQTEPIYLSVDKENKSAIKLYEKYGFDVVQEKYDTLVMTKYVL